VLFEVSYLSDGIACRILIQNEQLEQVDTFPYLGSLITEDGECTTEFCTRLNRASLQKYEKVTAYRFQLRYARTMDFRRASVDAADARINQSFNHSAIF